MKPVERVFPAKLLLFGEYTVLHGGAALALPFRKYSGKWIPRDPQLINRLQPWCDYLKKTCRAFLFVDRLDGFFKDYEYVSTIPSGKGLGSSGALTASVYAHFAKDDVDDLTLVQERLGKMEGFFHGVSSGFDPLVSWVDQAISKVSNGEIRKVDVDYPPGVHCYLLDCGLNRGDSYISTYVAMSEQEPSIFESRLAAPSDQIIQSLTGEGDMWSWNTLFALSKAQYDLMSSVIVAPLRALWLKGISSEAYAMKLCGAGGGGYFLVFSENELESIADFKLEKVF